MLKRILCIFAVMMCVCLTSCEEEYIEPVKYIVTFDSLLGDTPKEVEVVEGNSVEYFAPELNDGYEFIGWTVDLETKELFDFDTIIDKHLILYAVWEIEVVVKDYSNIINDYVPDQLTTSIELPRRLDDLNLIWSSSDAYTLTNDGILVRPREDKVITVNLTVYDRGELFDYSKKEKEDQVGVVTGLAYTQFGGDILPIEVNYFAGKGSLILTGKLGDVMKESASIAFDYVKANADKFNIDKSLFDKIDVHIHVPEGAVPKDGPSAGITLTTAIVSVLTNRTVKANVAMTGEVTLRGNVLAIGGLKEKSISAHRSGINTVIIPKDNEKDLDELPQTILDEVKFIPVSSVEEVIGLALNESHVS